MAARVGHMTDPLDDLRADFPECFTPKSEDLLRRQLECWPEPPPDKRYVLKAPVSIALVESDGTAPTLKFVTLHTQEDLDRFVESGAGLGDLSARRQLSLICDKQPWRIGLAHP